MKKGSVLIRDNRLWHRYCTQKYESPLNERVGLQLLIVMYDRGRHNSSDQPRHMLAIVYTINWMKKSDIFVSASLCLLSSAVFCSCYLFFFLILQLGNGCQEVFEGTNLDIFNLKFRTDDINYLHL